MRITTLAPVNELIVNTTVHRGLDLLLASDRQRGMTNTIDRYLISTTSNSITREEEDRIEDTAESLESDIKQENDTEEIEDDR